MKIARAFGVHNESPNKHVVPMRPLVTSLFTDDGIFKFASEEHKSTLKAIARLYYPITADLIKSVHSQSDNNVGDLDIFRGHCSAYETNKQEERSFEMLLKKVEACDTLEDLKDFDFKDNEKRHVLLIVLRWFYNGLRMTDDGLVRPAVVLMSHLSITEYRLCGRAGLLDTIECMDEKTFERLLKGGVFTKDILELYVHSNYRIWKQMPERYLKIVQKLVDDELLSIGLANNYLSQMFHLVTCQCGKATEWIIQISHHFIEASLQTRLNPPPIKFLDELISRFDHKILAYQTCKTKISYSSVNFDSPKRMIQLPKGAKIRGVDLYALLAVCLNIRRVFKVVIDDALTYPNDDLVDIGDESSIRVVERPTADHPEIRIIPLELGLRLFK